jgi:hypothetical protein
MFKAREAREGDLMSFFLLPQHTWYNVWFRKLHLVGSDVCASKCISRIIGRRLVVHVF